MIKISAKVTVTLILTTACVVSTLAGEGIWNSPRRITEFPSTASVPDLASGPFGKLHLVWYDDRDGNFEIYYKEWYEGGWSEVERLTCAPGESVRPQVASDPFGRVHVVWHDERDGDFEIYYKNRDGTLWSGDQRLTFDGHNQSYPSVAADAVGDVHVVWSDLRIASDNSEIYYLRGDGFMWESELRLTESEGFSSKPAVAAGPDGLVHVTWYDTREGVREVFYKYWDGVAWSPDERVSDSLSGSWYQNMAVDEDGNLHVVWLDRQDGNWEVYYRRRASGGGWQDIERISFDEGRAAECEVCVDSSGRVHVVWRDNRDGNLEIYYAAFTGSRWTGETRLSFTSQPSKRPTIGVDGDDRIIVVFMDDRDGDTGLFQVKGRLPYLDTDTGRDVRDSR